MLISLKNRKKKKLLSNSDERKKTYSLDPEDAWQDINRNKIQNRDQAKQANEETRTHDDLDCRHNDISLYKLFHTDKNIYKGV